MGVGVFMERLSDPAAVNLPGPDVISELALQTTDPPAAKE
jgi:hypothetical protein